MAIDGITGALGNILNNQLKQTQLELMQTFERLSSGRRINRASDDPAGLAIATKLESQQRAMAVAERNAQMGIAMSRTAEGYLSSVTDDVQRIRELSVQAANGTLTDQDRTNIQMEIDSLKENIDFTFSSAQFNTKDLFTGTTEQLQIGAGSGQQMEMQFPAMSTQSLGLDTLNVTTQAGAEAGITAASDALDTVTSARSQFGSYENRLTSTLNSLSESWLNTTRSLSNIRDANMAEELINASRVKTQLEAQLMVASQVMKLQGGLIQHLFE